MSFTFVAIITMKASIEFQMSYLLVTSGFNATIKAVTIIFKLA